MSTWTHHQLGDFRFDEHFWRHSIRLPAFNVFTQPIGRIPERPEEIDIWIQALDATDKPTASIANLITTVIANHKLLIPRIIESLFNEFSGTGPPSGMWWHGEIEELRDNASRGYYGDINPGIAEPDELRKLLSLPDLAIREIGWHARPWVDGSVPVAEFGFGSPIDPEHGIGVLTDGVNIIGIGYSCDASLFSENR